MSYPGQLFPLHFFATQSGHFADRAGWQAKMASHSLPQNAIAMFVTGIDHLRSEDELLLTLCKLRHNFPQDDLAMRFCVNQSTVSRIFSCWTEILEACVNEFPLWPDKISDQEDMPAAFQNLYADTRVIIDAAEIEIDRPSNPDTQSLTWSEYKNWNTAKFLLTVTQNGVPCFVSQCFGGRISGRELVQHSGFLGKTDVRQERFEAGDAIMADKGFDIVELLKSRKLKLNHVLFIPSLVRVRRPCRGLEKFFPPVLQRCYGCSFHAQEIVHTGHGMLGYFCFFLFGEKGACPN